MAIRIKKEGGEACGGGLFRPLTTLSSPAAAEFDENETMLLELNKDSGGNKHLEFIGDVLFGIILTLRSKIFPNLNFLKFHKKAALYQENVKLKHPNWKTFWMELVYLD